MADKVYARGFGLVIRSLKLFFYIESISLYLLNILLFILLDSLHGDKTTMKAKESNVSPKSLEENKQDKDGAGQFKPLVIIAQIMMIYAFGGLSYLTSVIGPKKRGFFCGDESIRYPYRGSTIPIPFLYLGCYIILISTILLIETLCEKYRYTRYKSKLPIKFECNGFIIPGIIVRFIRFFSKFLYTFKCF